MNRTEWNPIENKLFEQAIVSFPSELPDRWERIAAQLPGKSVDDIKEHYDALVHDVLEIDSGRVEVPDYKDEGLCSWDWDLVDEFSLGEELNSIKKVEVGKKKGKPWTKEEHKLFLIGLNKYGKGDWRSISRNVVKSRTPSQVASHAQKYFLRQNSMTKERKRSSIHDITTVDSSAIAVDDDDIWTPPPAGSIPQQLPIQFPDQAGVEGYPNYSYPM